MRYLSIVFLFVGLIGVFSCGGEEQGGEKSATSAGTSSSERPVDPWVIDNQLDDKSNVVTIALNKNMWLAYDKDNAAIYKAWSGGLVDGKSAGDAWLVGQFQNPWMIVEGENEIVPEATFKGHQMNGDNAQLEYELSWNDKKATVIEEPVYSTSKSGMPILVRTFTTKNILAEAQVKLKTNVSSLVFKNKFETDGEWKELSSASIVNGKTETIDLSGELTLKSNAATMLKATFAKKPSIENKNQIASNESAEPIGYQLINRSGCRACHNSYKKLIGPAYIDVAKKYENTEENVKYLASKVKEGGSGVWGEVMMNPHPHLPTEDIEKMCQYILAMDTEKSE